MELLLITLFAFLGVVAQTVVGFGVGPFLIPILFILFSPSAAIAIILFVSNILCLLMLISERRDSGLVWPIVARLFLASLPGIIIGAYILTHSNKGIMLLTAGILIICSIIIQEYFSPKPRKPFRVSPGISLSGFMAGVLTSVAATAPVPLVLWMRSHITTPNQIRHNLAAIFFLMNIASIPAIYWFRHTSLSMETLIICGLLIPITIIGYALGKFLVSKINVKVYRKLVFSAVILSGVLSTVLGIQILI